MKIRDWLLENNYTITSDEHKSYGSYYSARKKYNKEKREIELSISDVKDFETIYVNIRENHFRGNCNGYVDKIEDIQPIVQFMTEERRFKKK